MNSKDLMNKASCDKDLEEYALKKLKIHGKKKAYDFADGANRVKLLGYTDWTITTITTKSAKGPQVITKYVLTSPTREAELQTASQPQPTAATMQLKPETINTSVHYQEQDLNARKGPTTVNPDVGLQENLALFRPINLEPGMVVVVSEEYEQPTLENELGRDYSLVSMTQVSNVSNALIDELHENLDTKLFSAATNAALLEAIQAVGKVTRTMSEDIEASLAKQIANVRLADAKVS